MTKSTFARIDIGAMTNTLYSIEANYKLICNPSNKIPKIEKLWIDLEGVVSYI